MVDDAPGQGRPEVFNTDHGVQFTAEAFTGRLESAGRVVIYGRPGARWTTASSNASGGR
jgi:putative transposase